MTALILLERFRWLVANPHVREIIVDVDEATALLDLIETLRAKP